MKNTPKEQNIANSTKARWRKRDKKSRPTMKVSGRGMKTLAQKLSSLNKD